jgi:hypothetical protein
MKMQDRYAIMNKLAEEKQKALETFKPKKIKAKKLNISDEAKYKGQEMDWTEDFTGKEILAAGTKLYHYSWNKINSFFPKTTCFYDNCNKLSHNIYCLILKKDIELETYGNEYRIDLDKYRDDVDIYYIGYGESFSVKDEYDRVIGSYSLQHIADGFGS